MGQEGFAFIEAGAGVVAGGVVEQVEQGLFVRSAGQEGVGRGVVWPEGAQVADLPAFDGLGRPFVAGVGSQFVFHGPAADAGAVGFKVQASVQFAGGGAVGGGRLGGKKFGEQGGRGAGPGGVMVAAGVSGRPGADVTLGASLEVVTVEFVEAGARQPQFAGGVSGGKLPGAVAVQQVADEGSREAFDELELFIRTSLPEESGFIALRLMPAGASRAAVRRPDRPFIRLEAALRLRPRRALSSAQAG